MLLVPEKQEGTEYKGYVRMPRTNNPKERNINIPKHIRHEQKHVFKAQAVF